MSNPKVAIDIVGNNLVDRGVGAAEKRLDKLGKHAAGIGKGMGKLGDRGGLGNFVRTFAEVDAAVSGAFGRRSVFGTLDTRLGAVRRAGSALNAGLGRTSQSLGQIESVGASASASLGTTAVEGVAAAEGMEAAAGAAGGLALAMGPVAIVGAAAVATLGAATVAGYKFASGWAASTAQMGRFADMIGVASRDLQELQGAAERYGIGKDATSGAVSSFAQGVHDARYGRNNETLALLTRLGVKFRTGADGNLDYSAMLADTSDAIARQKDPQTRLMIANRLGIAGMLPLLSKGSGTLRSEMADVGQHGVVNSSADIATAEKFNRNSVLLGQMFDRTKQGLQAATAGKYNPALDGGVYLAQHASVAGAARAIGDGADKIDRAADKMLAAVGGSSRGIVTDARFGAGAAGMAHLIETVGERSKQWQQSSKGAVGVMQLLPETARAVAQRNGIPFDEHRLRTDAGYNRMLGNLEVGRLWSKYHDPALVAAAYNAGDGRLDGHHGRGGWLRTIGDPRTGAISDRDFADAIGIDETRKYAQRILGAQQTDKPVHHIHEFKGLPQGTAVKSRTNGSPRVSMSFSDE